MNAKTLIKALFALNLVLIATITALLLRQPKVQLAPLPSPGVASREAPPAVSPPNPQPYASLTSEPDWRQWIDTLRESGVPTRVLARLVREGFDDRWQKRQGEAHAAYMRGELDADGLAALGFERDFEQEKAIRAALGEEDFRKWDMQNVLESLNLRDIQLSAAETNALYDLVKSHRRLLEELGLSKLKGEIDQATMEERQAKAQTEHDAQLKALLGEQRCAAMQGTDDNAASLKHGLRELNASLDVPFETLLEAQTRWNERHHEMTAQLQEVKNQAANLEHALKRMDESREQEFQRLLGTNVFDALEREQDARYKEMKRHADTWRLEDAAADYLYRTIRYYEKAVADYQVQARAVEAQGREVDWDAVNNNLKQFAQQNEQALRNYLGDERFDKIKSNGIFPFAPVK